MNGQAVRNQALIANLLSGIALCFCFFFPASNLELAQLAIVFTPGVLLLSTVLLWPTAKVRNRRPLLIISGTFELVATMFGVGIITTDLLDLAFSGNELANYLILLGAYCMTSLAGILVYLNQLDWVVPKPRLGQVGWHLQWTFFLMFGASLLSFFMSWLTKVLFVVGPLWWLACIAATFHSAYEIFRTNPSEFEDNRAQAEEIETRLFGVPESEKPWIDEPSELLSGLTPRQAVSAPEQRQKLEQLLEARERTARITSLEHLERFQESLREIGIACPEPAPYQTKLEANEFEVKPLGRKSSLKRSVVQLKVAVVLLLVLAGLSFSWVVEQETAKMGWSNLATTEEKAVELERLVSEAEYTEKHVGRKALSKDALYILSLVGDDPPPEFHP